MKAIESQQPLGLALSFYSDKEPQSFYIDLNGLNSRLGLH